MWKYRTSLEEGSIFVFIGEKRMRGSQKGRTRLDYSLGKTLNGMLRKIWTLFSTFEIFLYILNSFQGELRRLLNREVNCSWSCFEGIPGRGIGTVNGRWVPEKATKQAQILSSGLFQERVRSEIQQPASSSGPSFFISWFCNMRHMSLGPSVP